MKPPALQHNEGSFHYRSSDVGVEEIKAERKLGIDVLTLLLKSSLI
jgi:hypothetical protein